LLALAVGLWRRLGPARIRDTWSRVATLLAVLMTPIIAWLTIASTRGQVTDSTTTAAFTVDRVLGFFSYLWQFYLPRLPFQVQPPTYKGQYGLWDRFVVDGFGAFGWLEFRLPTRVYDVLAALSAIAMAAVLVVIARRRGGLDKALIAFLALAFFTLLGGLHWTDYVTLTDDKTPFMQGRYLLPLAGLMGVGVAASLTLLARRGRAVVVGALLAGLVALQVLSLGVTLLGFYA
jgi:hypothetical protein